MILGEVVSQPGPVGRDRLAGDVDVRSVDAGSHMLRDFHADLGLALVNTAAVSAESADRVPVAAAEQQRNALADGDVKIDPGQAVGVADRLGLGIAVRGVVRIRVPKVTHGLAGVAGFRLAVVEAEIPDADIRRKTHPASGEQFPEAGVDVVVPARIRRRTPRGDVVFRQVADGQGNARPSGMPGEPDVAITETDRRTGDGDDRDAEHGDRHDRCEDRLAGDAKSGGAVKNMTIFHDVYPFEADG